MRRAWSWYQSQLTSRPVRTQAVTSAMLWAGGDVIAQQVDMYMSHVQRERQRLRQQHEGDCSSSSSSSSSSPSSVDASPASVHVERQSDATKPMLQGEGAAAVGKHQWRERPTLAAAAPGASSSAVQSVQSPAEAIHHLPSTNHSCDKDDGATGLDVRRVFTTGLYGAAFVGPAGHYWYDGLERFVRHGLKYKPKSFRFIAAKTFLDTFVFGPIHLAAFFTWTGYVSGHSFEKIQRDIGRDFVPAFIAEATVWPVIQVANFRFIPVEHQLLFVNVCCLLDSAWLSWLKYEQDAAWKAWLWNHLIPQRLSPPPMADDSAPSEGQSLQQPPASVKTS